jgi:hypothetical protein
VFVGVSVAYLVIQESSPLPAVQGQSGRTELAGPGSGAPGDMKATLKEPNQQADHKLIAYYFHRTQRCRTCLAIEAYAEEALKDAFPETLKTGELEWRTANLDDPANEHFVADYELTASALVLVNTQNGEQKGWRNLERVWELVGDELKFKAYVESEAIPFLEKEP